MDIVTASFPVDQQNVAFCVVLIQLFKTFEFQWNLNYSCHGRRSFNRGLQFTLFFFIKSDHSGLHWDKSWQFYTTCLNIYFCWDSVGMDILDLESVGMDPNCRAAKTKQKSWCQISSPLRLGIYHLVIWQSSTYFFFEALHLVIKQYQELILVCQRY